MDFPGLLAQLLNGVQYGLLLFLIASGLTLIFGVMGIINLAHGSLFMIGAYLAFLVARQWGSVWLALPVAVAAGIALGLVLERGLFRHFYAREHLDQVLLTFAPHLAVRGGALAAGRQRLLFGARALAARFLGADHCRVQLFGLPLRRHRHLPRPCRGCCSGGSSAPGWAPIIRAAAEKPEMVDVLGIDARARAHGRVRHRHGAGADRGRAGGPALLRLSQHGRRLPHHLLRRRGDRRPRLRLRRLLVGADHRPRRHAGQSLLRRRWPGSPSTC